jgi:hypothetical protein
LKASKTQHHLKRKNAPALRNLGVVQAVVDLVDRVVLEEFFQVAETAKKVAHRAEE